MARRWMRWAPRSWPSWKTRARRQPLSRSMFPRGRKLKSGEVAAHLAFGARLRSYSFRQIPHPQSGRIQEASFHAESGNRRCGGGQAGLSGAGGGGGRHHLARDLVNEPPNVLHPEEFARRAKALTKLGVKVEVLGEAEMKQPGLRRAAGRGPGQCARKPAGGDAVAGRQEEKRAGRLCRQGRVFRFRRPLAQAGQPA